MEFYTEKAYEVSVARKLMLTNNKRDISSQSFNILYYFCMTLKGFLKKLRCEPDWPKTKLYEESCE